jgi:hypothetical protein
MLGQGLRVVLGFCKRLTVTTRGIELTLQVDQITGLTNILKEREVDDVPGLRVSFTHPTEDPDDAMYWAKEIIRISQLGANYRGPSLPSWSQLVHEQPDLLIRQRSVVALPRTLHMAQFVFQVVLEAGWVGARTITERNAKLPHARNAIAQPLTEFILCAPCRAQPLGHNIGGERRDR